MSEGRAMDCGEFSEVAAELALGVLTGRERGDALAHLEYCGTCRDRVRQLVMTGEELVGLLPAVEPPPGFETRVMARIGIDPGPRPARRSRAGLRWPRASLHWPRARFDQPRRMLAAAAVTLAVLAAGFGGWGLRAATSAAPAPSPLTSAALVSAGHRTVGEVFYHAGSRPWMYMSVDVPSGDGITVTCQLEGPAGRYTTVGSFSLAGGYGAWGGPTTWAYPQVTGARLLGPGGKILATARF